MAGEGTEINAAGEVDLLTTLAIDLEKEAPSSLDFTSSISQEFTVVEREDFEKHYDTTWNAS
ncbi:hypothetical protein DAPPUDRAFT_270820 [Daphnia pulex]|uniref:Uncharacterized protein n=1 Tax=Daphnia pulex TaxID=6669 RepID=E9I1C8_DAPPU|nr:hypothetical protein DAPPUDRAFT_270820 [Daphnia pulex]|eukprot:EFX62202.1 hypothetical protein DAPPUDRAFT_270820 [Daphnia pulex]